MIYIIWIIGAIIIGYIGDRKKIGGWAAFFLALLLSPLIGLLAILISPDKEQANKTVVSKAPAARDLQSRV